MQALMKEQAAKDAADKPSSAKKPDPADAESSMLSSSMSAIGRSAQKEAEQSYASDTFEDVSMSGSNSKSSSGFQKKVGRLAAANKLSSSAVEESETYQDEFESLS